MQIETVRKAEAVAKLLSGWGQLSLSQRGSKRAGAALLDATWAEVARSEADEAARLIRAHGLPAARERLLGEWQEALAVEAAKAREAQQARARRHDAYLAAEAAERAAEQRQALVEAAIKAYRRVLHAAGATYAVPSGRDRFRDLDEATEEALRLVGTLTPDQIGVEVLTWAAQPQGTPHTKYGRPEAGSSEGRREPQRTTARVVTVQWVLDDLAAIREADDPETVARERAAAAAERLDQAGAYARPTGAPGEAEALADIQRLRDRYRPDPRGRTPWQRRSGETRQADAEHAEVTLVAVQEISGTTPAVVQARRRAVAEIGQWAAAQRAAAREAERCEATVAKGASASEDEIAELLAAGWLHAREERQWRERLADRQRTRRERETAPETAPETEAETTSQTPAFGAEAWSALDNLRI